jgi:hypothetical protein
MSSHRFDTLGPFIYIRVSRNSYHLTFSIIYDQKAESK